MRLTSTPSGCRSGISWLAARSVPMSDCPDFQRFADYLDFKV
jgi:hypothetical protein